MARTLNSTIGAKSLFCSACSLNAPHVGFLPQFKNYDELTGLPPPPELGVKRLEEHRKGPTPRTGNGSLNSLDVLHPLGREGIPEEAFQSCPTKPQAGTPFSPRAASRNHGPSERFVANLADWDRSIILIPAGQSGQPGSEHYTDQFHYWFEGKPIYDPFSDAAEAKVKKHTLTLKP